VVSGNWLASDGTAAGCSNFQNYLFNPVYVIRCTQRTRLLLRLTCRESEAINVTVFRPVNTGAFRVLACVLRLRWR
jgi:hypothetical protein